MRIASIVVVLGLATILAGEVAVFIEYDALQRQATTRDVSAIRRAQQEMWPVMGLGASFIAAGLLLSVVNQKARRRHGYGHPGE